MILKAKHLLALLLVLVIIASPALPAFTASADGAEPLKKRVTYFTEEERANIKENAAKLDWAKSAAADYKSIADKYISRGFDFLWNVLPSQGLPRSYGVNQKLGCLNCGKEIDKYGNYPYKYDLLEDPWKLTCPNCGMKFPTNDFESFYKSALDEGGNFDASRGDTQYLKNVLYPEKGENWGVDNGWGYKASNGGLYTFIAYWNHWAIYDGGMENVMEAIYYAYLCTGDQKYADAGIVLLDRMAQIYPDMNIKDLTVAKGFLHSHGGRDGYGKILGCIWECSIIRPYIIAYDAFFPAYETMSKEAKDYLAKVSGGKRNTANALKVHVENGLIKEIYPAVRNKNIDGNEGMHQQTLAAAAVVIDDPSLTKLWMDYNMSSDGGKLLTIFVNSVDRDGYGNEAAPGYNSGWVSNFLGVAEILKGYKIGGTGESYDLYENVKFKKMIYSFIDLLLCNKLTPPIGDTGKTGYVGTVANKTALTLGYSIYNDDYLAQALYLINGDSTDGLRLDISEKDPDSISAKIQKVIDEKGTLALGSVNLTGYGFAVTKGFAAAAAAAPETPKSNITPFNTLEVIRKSEKENLEIVSGEDGHVVFKNDASGKATASFGFYTSEANYIYDISLKIIGTGSDSVLDVYVDGKSLQENVKFSGKSGAENQIYFRKTRELSKGYHILTLQFVSGASVDLKSLIVIKSAAAISSASSASGETSMYIYYGRNTGHGHADNLNLGFYAYGMDLMPDIGYPEFADAYDMHRRYFVSNTVSHNTVMVNGTRQDSVVVSTPLLFDSSDFVKLISVDGKGAYSAASEYKRTSAMIKIGNGQYYLVDFFNVTGGKTHEYVLHGASASATAEGLTLKNQTDGSGSFVGTMAGPDVSFGGKNQDNGYQYFERVRRDSDPGDVFSVDWAINDHWGLASAAGIHLKVTVVGESDEVTLADATPPTNKGNMKNLTYLFVKRQSTSSLTSLFNSVIEPYTGAMPTILSVEQVPVTENGKDVSGDHIRALKITHVTGRVDYVAYNALDRTKKLTVDNAFEFTGTFAVYTVSDGGTVIYTNDANVPGKTSPEDRLTGTVTAFTQELSTENSITVKLDSSVDAGSLAGKYVYIDRLAGASFNACYRIISAERKNGEYVLNIGDVTPIEAYKNAANVNGGYKYSIAVGKSLYIPLSETAGDAEAVLGSSGSTFSSISLATGAKKDAKSGDFIGNLFAVNSASSSVLDLVPYSITLIKGACDNDRFEIKDNKLYAAGDLTSTGKYTVLAYVNYTKDGKNKKDLISFDVPVLSKSASDSLVYPEFSIEPDPERPEGDPSDPTDPDGPDGPEAPSGTNVGLIIGIVAAVIVIAAAAIVIINIKKKKKED